MQFSYKKIFFSSPKLSSNDKKNLISAYNSSWISQGNFNLVLEKKFMEFLNKKYALSCANGTLALQMILMSLNLKFGDEVIIPSMCYISPCHSTYQQGLKIKLCKINHSNLQIDINYLSEIISKKTKVLLLIHNYGNMSDVILIKKICRKKKF